MKTICIYHRADLDGLMSAGVVKHWFIKNYDNPVITDESQNQSYHGENRLHMLGWHYGDNIPDLSEYGMIIMVDISFPKEEMYKLFLQFSGKFIWIDHHISAFKDNGGDFNNKTFKFGTYNDNLVSGLRDVNYAACELTWMFFMQKMSEPPHNVNDVNYSLPVMPEIVRMLGMYDSFGHKGTVEEQKVLEFQYGARQEITNYQEAFAELIKHETQTIEEVTNIDRIRNKGKAIYQFLCKKAQKLFKRGFSIILKEKVNDEAAVGKFVSREFLCINSERFNLSNFGIDYHNEGYDGIASFWLTDNGKWEFSLYNENGEVDCSNIAEQYGGGGHKSASGMRVDNIDEFLKNHKL